MPHGGTRLGWLLAVAFFVLALSLLRSTAVVHRSTPAHPLPAAQPPAERGAPPSARSSAYEAARAQLVEYSHGTGTLVLGSFSMGRSYDFATLFLQHWLCTLRRLRIDNYAAAATDEQALEFGRSRRAQVVDGRALLPAVNFTERRKWRHLLLFKPHFVRAALRAGLHVLWCDLDVVLLADPFAFLARLGPPRVPRGRDGGGGPRGEPPGLAFTVEDTADEVNTGLYYMRADEQNARLLDAWVGACERAGERDGHDQALLNRLLSARSKRGAERLAWATLPLHAFPNGRALSKWRDGTRVRLRPGTVALHANCIWGASKKVMALKANGLWQLGEGGQCLGGDADGANASAALRTGPTRAGHNGAEQTTAVASLRAVHAPASGARASF